MRGELAGAVRGRPPDRSEHLQNPALAGQSCIRARGTVTRRAARAWEPCPVWAATARFTAPDHTRHDTELAPNLPPKARCRRPRSPLPARGTGRQGERDMDEPSKWSGSCAAAGPIIRARVRRVAGRYRLRPCDRDDLEREIYLEPLAGWAAAGPPGLVGGEPPPGSPLCDPRDGGHAATLGVDLTREVERIVGSLVRPQSFWRRERSLPPSAAVGRRRRAGGASIGVPPGRARPTAGRGRCAGPPAGRPARVLPSADPHRAHCRHRLPPPSDRRERARRGPGAGGFAAPAVHVARPSPIPLNPTTKGTSHAPDRPTSVRSHRRAAARPPVRHPRDRHDHAGGGHPERSRTGGRRRRAVRRRRGPR